MHKKIDILQTNDNKLKIVLVPKLTNPFVCRFFNPRYSFDTGVLALGSYIKNSADVKIKSIFGHLGKKSLSETDLIKISDKNYLREYVNYILDEVPDIVGLSCLDTSLLNTVVLSKAIKKKNKNVKIILGGPGIFYNYSELMDNFIFIDYCIIGEGEIALEKLIDYLNGKISIGSVPSLVYRNGSHILANKPAKCVDINALPYLCFDLYDIQSIYFGGGTPSRLSRELLSSLVGWIKTLVPSSLEIQWAIEVNPEDISQPHAYEMRKLGFSRVSVGVQSFQTEALYQLGRNHHPQQSRNAIKYLRQAGFEDINLDLMIAYPGQTLDSLKKDLEEFVSWDPTHISIYLLTIEEKTNFARKPHIRKWQAENELLISQMYETVIHFLAEQGINQYEISNFAKPGYQSTQNLIYWKGKNYLGLGLGSHSLIRPRRWGNHRRWVDYRQCLENDTSPVQETEKLGAEEEKNEKLMLQLRLTEGLDLKAFSLEFQLDLDKFWKNKLDEYIRSNLAIIENDRLKLTVSGMLLADEITASLAAELP